MVAVGELRDLEASLEDLIFQWIDHVDRWSLFATLCPKAHNRRAPKRRQENETYKQKTSARNPKRTMHD